VTDEAARPTRTTLRTADGLALVAEHTVPSGPVRGGASVAHPHPYYGGTMHDAVAVAIDRALVARGIATVRFAFRGTGGSEGMHTEGPDEREDVRAALAHAATLAPGAPLLACGYSFGADVTLATVDDTIRAWLVAAPALRVFDEFPSALDARPKHLFVAAHDQYTPPDAARAVTLGWTNTTVHVVDMADHFFRGALDALTAQLTSTLATLDLA
jgi:uncharacterized protein